MDPAPVALITPDDDPIVATPVLLLVQVPPAGVPFSVCAVVAQTGVDSVNDGMVLMVCIVVA